MKIILSLVNLGAAIFFAADLAGHFDITEWRDRVILISSIVFLALNSIFMIFSNNRVTVLDSRAQPGSAPQTVLLVNGGRRFLAGVAVAVCCALLLTYGMNEIRLAISGGPESANGGSELSLALSGLRDARAELASVQDELKELRDELSGVQMMLFETVRPQW
jgi:hypothetical protein